MLQLFALTQTSTHTAAQLTDTEGCIQVTAPNSNVTVPSALLCSTALSAGLCNSRHFCFESYSLCFDHAHQLMVQLLRPGLCSVQAAATLMHGESQHVSVACLPGLVPCMTFGSACAAFRCLSCPSRMSRRRAMSRCSST